MTAQVMLALTLAAAALVAFPLPATLPNPDARANAGRAPLTPRVRRAVVMTVGTAAAVALLLPGWWIGLPVGVGMGVVGLRLPERRSATQQGEDRRALAVHADLLAACLDSGMPIGAALVAVRASAARGSRTDHRTAISRRVTEDDPIELLDGVAALLMLGVDPDSAWRSAQSHPDLAALAAAARRSAAGGAGFAAAVREHAAVLRAAIAGSAERSAGRAGVAMTAPLGLCFLPAFLCLGLAPVVVGLVSTLHLF